MKTLLALIVAVAGFAAATPEASAGGYCGTGHGYYPPSTCHVYKLYTKESCRHYFTKTYHNSCGHCYTVRYVNITYVDYYSNGSTRSYNRTFRA